MYPRKYQDQLASIEEGRRKLQRENEDKFKTALVEVKEDLRLKEGEEIAEKLKNDIRDWFQKEQ